MSAHPLEAARSHEVRAWAASLAASHSTSLSQVLDAAYWRRTDVFTSHYLRDCARTRGDGSYGLPALVAAQVVLSSHRV